MSGRCVPIDNQFKHYSMKRLLFLFLILPLCATAQVRFGYLNYDEVLKQMPEFAEAQQNVSALKAKYDQEANRSEEEFQRKFSEFLQGQKDFPENILLKRQAELQTLMETGLSFRQEARQLLTKAERELIAGVQNRLNEAIRMVGEESGYAYVINTAGNACPYINPALGEDVTFAVLKRLGIEVSDGPSAEFVAEPTDNDAE